jgi:hypothetical protein
MSSENLDNVTVEPSTKKTVHLELEVDTVQKEIVGNKYQGIIDLAKAVDSWRIFPRIFITTYIYLLYKSTIWFMALPDPNNAQAGLISVIVGAGAAWFGLYCGSGPKMQSSTTNTASVPSTIKK